MSYRPDYQHYQSENKASVYQYGKQNNNQNGYFEKHQPHEINTLTQGGHRQFPGGHQSINQTQPSKIQSSISSSPFMYLNQSMINSGQDIQKYHRIDQDDSDDSINDYYQERTLPKNSYKIEQIRNIPYKDELIRNQYYKDELIRNIPYKEDSVQNNSFKDDMTRNGQFSHSRKQAMQPTSRNLPIEQKMPHNSLLQQSDHIGGWQKQDNYLPQRNLQRIDPLEGRLGGKQSQSSINIDSCSVNQRQQVQKQYPYQLKEQQQFLEKSNLPQTYKSVASKQESTTDEDYISQIEVAKLKAEKISDIKKFGNIKNLTEEEVKKQKEELAKKLNNKNQNSNGIKSNEFEFEDEMFSKQPNKMSIDKVYKWDERLENSKTSALVSLMKNFRNYEEDGIENQEKTKLLQSDPIKNQLHRSYSDEDIFITDVQLFIHKKNMKKKKLKTEQHTEIEKQQKMDEDIKEDHDGDSSLFGHQDEFKRVVAIYSENDNEIEQKSKMPKIQNSKQKSGRSKLPCDCQENREDELRLCDNLKCKKQWFHKECIKENILRSFKEQEGGIPLIPKDDDEWFCDECKQNKESIQLRVICRRKALQKQRNRVYFEGKQGELGENIGTKESKKKSTQKGCSSISTFRSDNSNSFKSENSNQFQNTGNKEINPKQSFQQTISSSNSLKHMQQTLSTNFQNIERKEDNKTNPILNDIEEEEEYKQEENKQPQLKEYQPVSLLKEKIQTETLKKQTNKQISPSRIVHCRVKESFTVKLNRRKIEISNNSQIIAFVRHNPLTVELYMLQPSGKTLDLFYSQELKTNEADESGEQSEVQHVVFNGNSYIVFGHSHSYTILSVFQPQFWRITPSTERKKPFFLASSEAGICIYTQCSQKDIMQCTNILPFERTIQISVERLTLDEKCQNFSQLTYFQPLPDKDNHPDQCFIFLSADRQTILIYPELSLISEKAIVNIGSPTPLNGFQVVNRSEKQFLVMDSNNQIFTFDTLANLNNLENKSVYQDKFPCLKYYTQPDTNILLQLYEDQIYISSLEHSFKPKALSFGKHFLDAIYIDSESDIVVLYVESEQSEDKQTLMYFLIPK